MGDLVDLTQWKREQRDETIDVSDFHQELWLGNGEVKTLCDRCGEPWGFNDGVAEVITADGFRFYIHDNCVIHTDRLA